MQEVGPYEVEVWYDETREIVYIKLRRWIKEPAEAEKGEACKRGLLIKVRPEEVEGVMEDVLPGMEYPEVSLLLPW